MGDTSVPNEGTTSRVVLGALVVSDTAYVDEALLFYGIVVFACRSVKNNKVVARDLSKVLLVVEDGRSQPTIYLGSKVDVRHMTVDVMQGEIERKLVPAEQSPEPVLTMVLVVGTEGFCRAGLAYWGAKLLAPFKAQVDTMVADTAEDPPGTLHWFDTALPEAICREPVI